MENNLNTQYLMQSNINIFDIFAALYDYCKSQYNDIMIQISKPDIKRKLRVDSINIQLACLPNLNWAKNTLDKQMTQNLLSYIGNNPKEYSLRCFTILDAIDKYYENIYPNCVFTSNFSDCVPPLNMDNSIGYVYPKFQAPILKIIQNKIIEWEEEGKEYFSIRPSDDIASYFFNLAFIKPPSGYNLVLKTMDSSIWQRFPDLLNCKIALVPLIRDLDQIYVKEFPIIDNVRPFIFTGLRDQDQIIVSIKEILTELDNKGVTIVIFPELSIPESIKTEIASWLNKNIFTSIKMIFCGSFHYLIEDKWYNVAHVLGPDGEQLWEQNKCKPYELKRYEAIRINSFSKWADYDSKENISTSPKTLVVYDTPLGRTIVLICKDFLLDTPEHQQVLVDFGINCAIVPAMTAELEPQFNMAANIYSNRAKVSTFISNNCASIREYGIYKWKHQNKEIKENTDIEIKISFIYLPGFKPDTWQRCQLTEKTCPKKDCMKYSIFSFKDWEPSN